MYRFPTNRVRRITHVMEECFFCRIVERAAESWKVYETDIAYAFLDIHPVSEYHTLVIPKWHHRAVGCTTLPSAIRPGGCWPTPCTAYWTPGSRWRALAIFTRRLDLDALLATREQEDGSAPA